MTEIAQHLGHEIVIAKYGYSDDTQHHTIECRDCMEIIIEEEN